MENCVPTRPPIYCTNSIPAPENPDLQIECRTPLVICEGEMPGEVLHCPHCGANRTEGPISSQK